ncbi:MAG: cation-transporting P-type ATPase, partial [Candidatus Sacchiramonaceae bacterium]|nr:cation-transporting P-type ATPase [Candidatus Saccharimonadaceae bacterium]
QGSQFTTTQPENSFSFNQDLAMSGNLWHEGSEFRLSIKGAPESFVERSSLSKKDKAATKDKIQEFASQGLRVIAVANIKINQTIATLEDLKDLDYQLELVGIVGVADILRPESADAIKVARKAGVSVRMITGDHPETAYHIGKELGLADNKEQIFDASQIKQLSDEELEAAVKKSLVFARITPESKYKILKILEKTEITAMTGDGVNDVPALAAANVGFAMGSGSEIAKDASDIVLLDDNFTSIITAMREGRVIVANIRRMLFYALSTNAGEALTMIGSLIIGIPLPLTPVQILWINLVTDTSLIIPLGLESASKEIMSKKPNKPDTPILSRTTVIRMIMVATLMSIISIIIYIFYSERLGHAEAQTLTFTALATMQWGNALNARSGTTSLRHRLKTKNNSFIIGMIIAIAAQAAALFTPLGELLHVTTVPFAPLILVSAIAFIAPIILVEIHKLFVKNKA